MGLTTYMMIKGNKLVSAFDDEALPSKQAEFIHSQFRSLVLSPEFPCPGAKTAFMQGTYRFGIFDSLSSKKATRELSVALTQFVKERKSIGIGFTTFVASFINMVPEDQRAFTSLLWEQLQMLHDVDSHKWDQSTSPDPSSSDFSFSFAGCSFFIVGLHAFSERWSRRFAWPTLVFNAHDQFELLREKGEFNRFRDIVRRRDTRLQGSHNPVLEDHGHGTEAAQYSGEKLPDDWKCPFKHKKTVNNNTHSKNDCLDFVDISEELSIDENNHFLRIDGLDSQESCSVFHKELIP